MKPGVELIEQERKEQIEKHNRSIQKDIMENGAGELRRGAIALICDHGQGDISQLPLQWSDEICLKMIKKSYVDRLVIAGAFIAAEIDRVNNKNNEK
jgi:glutamate mutase epsilon subunit